MTAQVEKQKEEFSPQQITQINQAQKSLNEIVKTQVAASGNQQAQSALNKIQTISLVNGNRLEANLILKEDQKLTDEEKKAIGTFLIEIIKKSEGETKKIAFIAFKDDGCTSKDLVKYMKDSKLEDFIEYKLKTASVSFSDDLQKSETSGEGSSTSTVKASLKWTDAEFEKFKKESLHVKLKDATKAQKMAIEKVNKSESKVGVEEIEGQKYIVVATGKKVGTKTEEGAILIPYNEKIQNEVSKKVNENIDEFMKTKSKYVITEEKAKKKSGFYMKDGEVWTSFIHSDGIRKQECLKDKNGIINEKVLKSTFYVLHNLEDKKWNKIRENNKFTKNDSDEVRKAFTKGVTEIEGYSELIKKARETYLKNNPKFEIDETAFILGYTCAIEKYNKEHKSKIKNEQSNSEIKLEYKGMPGLKLGEGLTLAPEKTEAKETTIKDESTLEFIKKNNADVERVVQAYVKRNELVEKYEISESKDPKWVLVYSDLRKSGYTKQEAAIALYGNRNKKGEFSLDVDSQNYISKNLDKLK